MVRRLISAFIEDDIQRKNIFHSCCMVNIRVKSYAILYLWKLLTSCYEDHEPLLLWPTNICLVLSSPLDSLPRVFVRMLNKFKILFNEMPKELLPLYGIKHQIDFISSSSLPNRPTYRVNLEESKEI
ncbi:hypothetical protein CR513_05737, partial [Mucuna pruriens]